MCVWFAVNKFYHLLDILLYRFIITVIITNHVLYNYVKKYKVVVGRDYPW